MAFSREDALHYLSRAHEHHRLAHAYLFSGPANCGKRALAAALTELVNGTKAADVFTAQAGAVFVAEPESKSRRIVIEQVRDLEHSLQMRAANGRRKVAIIVQADRLQPQAANAFLKTLEEPPNDSLLLLLSDLPEVLPDTIRSRCVPIPLAAPAVTEPTAEESALVDLLRAEANEKERGVEGAYRLVQGFQRSLGRIREQIQSETAAALKGEEARYKNTTDGAWLDEREDYYKALGESLYLQHRAGLLETLFFWWSDVLRARTNVAHRDLARAQKETALAAQQFTAPEILRRLRRLEELRDHLGRNIQETLALEAAFLQIYAR